MRIKFQFGLKWFLLATTLIAVLIGTVGKRAYDRWRNMIALESRERAIRELEEIGVRTSKKYYRDENRYGEIARLQFPMQVCKPRLFELAAEIGGLESLELWYTGFSDADVPTLDAHPNLKTLGLEFNPGITDQGLKSIAKFDSLEGLQLAATGITDQGLSEISRLPKLQGLGLERTAVTSSGLVHLRQLQSLRYLGLTFTNVDDSGLGAIAELRGLENISLANTKVRGLGLGALAELPKLETLSLRGCNLEDGSGLAKLKQISSLDMSDSQIRPGFLARICEMDQLRSLDLKGSAINDAHLAELGTAGQLRTLAFGKTITPGGPTYPKAASEKGFRELQERLIHTRIIGEP